MSLIRYSCSIRTMLSSDLISGANRKSTPRSESRTVFVQSEGFLCGLYAISEPRLQRRSMISRLDARGLPVIASVAGALDGAWTRFRVRFLMSPAQRDDGCTAINLSSLIDSIPRQRRACAAVSMGRPPRRNNDIRPCAHVFV